MSRRSRRLQGDPAREAGSAPEQERPEVERPQVERPEQERPEQERPEQERPEQERPEVERPEVERPEVERPEVERPEAERSEKTRGAASRFGPQLLLLAAVFAVAVLVAELFGAANLGVAFGVGQIAFAIAVVYLMLRR